MTEKVGDGSVSHCRIGYFSVTANVPDIAGATAEHFISHLKRRKIVTRLQSIGLIYSFFDFHLLMIE